jgi:hypothetical protein
MLRDLDGCDSDDMLRSRRFNLSPPMRVAMNPDGDWDAVGRVRSDGSLELPAKMISYSIDRLKVLKQLLDRHVHEDRARRPRDSRGFGAARDMPSH